MRPPSALLDLLVAALRHPATGDRPYVTATLTAGPLLWTAALLPGLRLVVCAGPRDDTAPGLPHLRAAGGTVRLDELPEEDRARLRAAVARWAESRLVAEALRGDGERGEA